MQWLIDLIIEAIGIPPTFIDRGDPAAADFIMGDLTIDGAWHELDLSAIVPEGASAVALAILLQNTVINKAFQVRTHGNVNALNVGRENTQTAVVLSSGDLIVAPDADRKIDYAVTAGGWVFIFVTVKGWWL